MVVDAFDLTLPKRTVFGAGKAKMIPALLESYGTRVLILTGKQSFLNSEHWDRLSLHLQDARIRWYQEVIDTEPSPVMIDGIVDGYRRKAIDAVVAIGGGSVLDAGKAVSAMIKTPGSVRDYLEGVGTHKPDGAKLPFIAVPTTSGTGSEATKNAVISEVGRDGFKKSLRHDNYVPDIALVDPELAMQCPASITASCGMDAFTQLLESYLSTRANRYTDALALDGLRLVARFLPGVVHNGGEDLEARSAMAYAAYLSGVTLANAGLGVVHGFASSVGAHFSVPHGMLCGTLMGAANKITLEKIKEQGGAERALEKYAAVGRIFSDVAGKPDAWYADSLVERIYAWTVDFGLGKLSDYGVRSHDIELLSTTTGCKNNPVELDAEALGRILAERL
jgi:alcohol dehydrogenase class IV